MTKLQNLAAKVFADIIESEDGLEMQEDYEEYHLSIRRFEDVVDCGCVEKEDGSFVLYKDYIDKIESLKKVHEEDLKRAYSRGRDNGWDSNYSWRV